MPWPPVANRRSGHRSADRPTEGVRSAGVGAGVSGTDRCGKLRSSARRTLPTPPPKPMRSAAVEPDPRGDRLPRLTDGASRTTDGAAPGELGASTSLDEGRAVK